jgi:hypothetical protein
MSFLNTRAPVIDSVAHLTLPVGDLDHAERFYVTRPRARTRSTHTTVHCTWRSSSATVPRSIYSCSPGFCVARQRRTHTSRCASARMRSTRSVRVCETLACRTTARAAWVAQGTHPCTLPIRGGSCWSSRRLAIAARQSSVRPKRLGSGTHGPSRFEVGRRMRLHVTTQRLGERRRSS